MNSNLCDQHPVCDPGEDTDGIAQDEFNCLESYKEKKLSTKEATYLCQSIYHNEDSVAANHSLGIVMIKAVPCDGIATCWEAWDESLCDSDFLTKWIPGTIVVIMSFSPPTEIGTQLSLIKIPMINGIYFSYSHGLCGSGDIAHVLLHSLQAWEKHQNEQDHRYQQYVEISN